MKRALAALILSVFATAASAQEPPAAELVRDAMTQFDSAHESLQAAEGASDRVKALSRVVSAYENGLESMRVALRQAYLREAELSRRFDAESEKVSELLGVLISLQPDATPEALVHPSGPLSYARAGMLVSAVTPALQAKAEDLRVRLQETSILRELQSEAMAKLEAGLEEVQRARTELSQAMGNRTELPRRFVTDAVRLDGLIESSQSLADFAEGLAVLDVVDGVIPLPDLAVEKGAWPLPVQGRLLRGSGEADAAGVVRPGWLLATRPRALVVAPAPATVRYRGAFLDYGNVIILEPAKDVLLVFAGLDAIYGEIGEVVQSGAAIGLMGGDSPPLDSFVEAATLGTGSGLSQTLYIEVRVGEKPVDPSEWFSDIR